MDEPDSRYRTFDWNAESAEEAIRSTNVARLASRVLFRLAAATAVVGVIGAAGSIWLNTSRSSTGRGIYGSIQWPLVLLQAASVLLETALPVGLMIAAGAFLRLHAARYETDLFDTTLSSDTDDNAG